MKISGLDKDTPLIIQEGGISINECIKLLDKDNVSEEILKECNFNPNDPNKESTNCRTNRGKISFKLAKEVFEKYYNEINTTDSGRLRGKMFDIKYNKKNKKILYSNEPCSEKYLEPEGPKKYDMWLVDAFPEAESIRVDKGTNVSTQYYAKDDNISSDLKYGPMITYGHLFNKNYNELYEKYLKETNDTIRAEKQAELEALQKTSDQLKDSSQIRLFNQYFSKISTPTWLKDYKENLLRMGTPPIYDLNSPEFKQSVIDARRKRENKKHKKSVQPLFMENVEKKTPLLELVEAAPLIEIPKLDIKNPDISVIPRLTIDEVFNQPEQIRTDEGLIDDINEYNKLILVDITETTSLFNKDTNYLYKLPFSSDFINTNDYDTIEHFFEENVNYLFDLLEKPITPFAILTYNGIKEL